MSKLSYHGISRSGQSFPSVRTEGVKVIVNVMDIIIAGRHRKVLFTVVPNGVDRTIGVGKDTGSIGVHENPTVPRLWIVCQCGNQICRSAAKAVPGNEKGTWLII